jgi:hypothetical protein
MAAGSIIIDLLMKTGSFSTDTKRASKSLEDFKKNAVQVGKAVGVAFASFAAAGLAAIGTSIRNQDEMIKTARAAGTTVESFSRLAYAANLGGVEQAKLGSALVKLSKNMSDAQQGIGEAQLAFDALGISVKNQDGTLKGTEATIVEVADKLSKYKDGAEKTALAVGIFGKAGAQLIPFLNSGKEGIEALTAEADRLGITLNTETAQAAEQFNDNLTRVGGITEGLRNQIAAELLPTLVNLTEGFFKSASGSDALKSAATTAATAVKLLISSGIVIGTVFQTVGQYLGGVAAIAVQLFQGNFKQAFDIGKQVVFDFGDNVQKGIERVNLVMSSEASKVEANSETLGNKFAAPLIKARSKGGKATKALKDEVLKTYEDIEKQIKAIEDRISKTDLSEVDSAIFDLEGAGATPEQIGRARELLEIEDEYRLRKEAIVEQEEAQARELERINNLLSNTPTAQLEALQDDMIFLRELFEEGRISLEQLKEAVGTRIGEATSEASDDFGDLERAIDGFAQKSAQSVADFAFGAETSFSDMVDSFLKDLARIALQKTIFDPIAESFGGIFTGGGNPFAGIFGGARAGGGNVKAGYSYNVGELGPERFVPDTNGRILPANQISGKNVSVVVNVDSQGIASQGNDSEAEALGNRIAQVVRSIITDEKRAGGLI